MSDLHLWRLKATNNIFYNVWLAQDTEPTIINFNGTHAVVPNSGSIIESRIAKAPRLTGEDGRLMVAPVIYPDFLNSYFTSEGDNYAAGTRRDGTSLSQLLTYDGTTVNHTFDVNFVEFVHLVGGKLWVTNGNHQDRINVSIEAPATPVTFNGSNLGNCNLVDVSGGYDLYHLIMPAPDNDGTHNVNLTEPMNANLAAGPNGKQLVTKVVPIPAFDDDGTTPIGNWEYNNVTGAVTGCDCGTGRFDLYDFPITLLRYVNDVAVGSSVPDNVQFINLSMGHRSAPFLPQWILRVKYTTANTHDVGDQVYYNCMLIMARRRSA